jgi:hypothetical protein
MPVLPHDKTLIDSDRPGEAVLAAGMGDYLSKPIRAA